MFDYNTEFPDIPPKVWEKLTPQEVFERLCRDHFRMNEIRKEILGLKTKHTFDELGEAPSTTVAER